MLDMDGHGIGSRGKQQSCVPLLLTCCCYDLAQHICYSAHLTAAHRTPCCGQERLTALRDDDLGVVRH